MHVSLFKPIFTDVTLFLHMVLTINLHFIMQALRTSCHVKLMLLPLEMLFSDYPKNNNLFKRNLHFIRNKNHYLTVSYP